MRGLELDQEEILLIVRNAVDCLNLDNFVNPIPIDNIKEFRVIMIREDEINYTNVTQIYERSLATAGDLFDAELNSKNEIIFSKEHIRYQDVKSIVKKLNIGILPAILVIINNELVIIEEEIGSPIKIIEMFRSLVDFS